MILTGAQRAGAAQLAWHLQRTDENELVELHQLRGFVARDLDGAFREVEAIASATRCRQCLFSVSRSPPASAQVSVAGYEAAIEKIEEKLGLQGQPRAIVFHEKDGRRHGHAVWSRIDIEEMRAIQLSHSKLKLRDVSKELFFEHGWPMPPGLVESGASDPANFSRAEWEMAKRAKRDPRALKAMFQECWAVSDGQAALAAALKERGFTLAKGDRRGVVAVDFRGDVFAVARWTGLRAKAVREKVADAEALPSVGEARAEIAARMTPRLQNYVREVETEAVRDALKVEFARTEMAARHGAERKSLKDGQAVRWAAETAERRTQLPTGASALWSWATGDLKKLQAAHGAEAWQGVLRDRREMDELILAQSGDRQTLRAKILAQRDKRSEAMASLDADLARYRDLVRAPVRVLAPDRDPDPRPQRQRDRGRGFEP